MKARGLKDPIAREKLYQEALGLLLDQETVIVPLYHEANQALVRGRVHGLELNPLNVLLLRNVNVGL
jgi:ABC-type oligopeptide transport system substrate-binding subunit